MRQVLAQQFLTSCCYVCRHAQADVGHKLLRGVEAQTSQHKGKQNPKYQVYILVCMPYSQEV